MFSVLLVHTAINANGYRCRNIILFERGVTFIFCKLVNNNMICTMQPLFYSYKCCLYCQYLLPSMKKDVSEEI